MREYPIDDARGLSGKNFEKPKLKKKITVHFYEM